MKKLAAIDAGADHFQILEVARDATKEQIKSAYFQLAKTFHPDRLPLLKLEHMRPQVEKIFARLSESFAVLGDDARRKEYVAVLAQGGEDAVKRRAEAENAQAMKILSAEEHFRLGEMAMRRQMWPQAMEEFKKALDANPEEAEHHALYAWCLWASATDKTEALAADVKKRLQKALEIGPKCAPAHYYLGQVALFQGDMDRAYGHFRKVLELRPGHLDAEREIRVIEMRRAKGGGGGGDKKPPGGGLLGGIFGKKK
jgi:tetratricopeptide (TPR) repeat protein